jgi:hypothetical protein
MAAMGTTLASGDWINPARMRAGCAMLLAATLVTCTFLVVTADGTLDWQGRPIGTDFSDVYAAGWLADQGRAAAAWDWPQHYAAQQAIHGSATVPFYGWHYPPPFLLIAALLAALPYLAALAVWQGATLAAASLLARAILPMRGTILAVLAAPASFVCLSHGQNAFLTASLLCGGLWLLDRRPWIAGLLLGGLIYKPQFALILPIALLAARDRRVWFGAALSSLTLAGTTLALWGWPVWEAFFASLDATRSVVIGAGATGWEKIASAFAALRALGAPPPLAYAAQTAITLVALAGAAAAARWADAALRNAALCCAALLATPYVLDYDLVILGGATVFLVSDARERGWLDWEKTLLAFAWLAPLCGRQVASTTFIPLNWIAIVVVFAVTMRRAWIFHAQRADRSTRALAA